MNLPSPDKAISELEKLEAHYAAQLEGVRNAIKGLRGSVSVSAPAQAPKPAKVKRRAPAGTLPEAVKKALAAKPGQSNKELREYLKTHKYKWPLSEIYMSKCLSKLKKDKEVTSVLNGKSWEYSLSEKKEKGA